MSDDTATVDVVQRLREYHAGETKYIATLADAVDEIEDNRALIEQQARTIAEQAARLEAMERDAGRYRYLRGRPEILNALSDVRALVDDQLREEWRKAYPHGGPGAWGPTENRHIDAAIDGAKT